MATECMEPMNVFPLDADGFKVEKPNLDELADYGLNLVIAIREIQEKAKDDPNGRKVYKDITDTLWEALDHVTIKLLQESIKQNEKKEKKPNN
jgi:hypothetical protein